MGAYTPRVADGTVLHGVATSGATGSVVTAVGGVTAVPVPATGAITAVTVTAADGTGFSNSFAVTALLGQ